jgi:WD40 repeat protein
VVNPHAGWVQTVAFRPSGKQLVSSHDDGTLRVWDPATGKAMLKIPANGTSLFSPGFPPRSKLISHPRICAFR